MRIVDKFSHLSAEVSLLASGSEYTEIRQSVNRCECEFGPNRPPEIKVAISKELSRFGWADRVPIHPSSNLTINYLKAEIGLSLQLGNVARTYADLLKLNFLGDRGVIKTAVIVVPDTEESRKLGQNYARFDRLVREVELFRNILATPLLVLSIGN